MDLWRQIIGHDGFLRADLRLNTPVEGGGKRNVQSGYRAMWWLVEGEEEIWLGDGPLDVVEGLCLKPGATGPVLIHPMEPSRWVGVGPGAVLHLRERRTQVLGVAVVGERVHVPDDAPLRLDGLRVRPGAVVLVERPSVWQRLKGEARRRR